MGGHDVLDSPALHAGAVCGAGAGAALSPVHATNALYRSAFPAQVAGPCVLYTAVQPRPGPAPGPGAGVPSSPLLQSLVLAVPLVCPWLQAEKDQCNLCANLAIDKAYKASFLLSSIIQTNTADRAPRTKNAARID